jgi:hypothetical protein
VRTPVVQVRGVLAERVVLSTQIDHERGEFHEPEGTA